MQTTDPRRLWADRLLNVARERLGPSISTPALPPATGDELGQRRPVDGPFFDWRRLRHGEAAAPTSPARTDTPDAPETIVWSSLIDPSVDLRRALRAEPDGPLLRWARPPGIEVWTECELAALHGLWWAGLVRNDAALRERCLAAARWHVENLQPDNATHRPWAVHVFVELGLADPSAGGDLHAQTLLHNCRVGAGTGEVDVVSAHILLDAAEALER